VKLHQQTDLMLSSTSADANSLQMTLLAAPLLKTNMHTIRWQKITRSHPEMVGDMSRVTLNDDLSKIPFVHF